jgi:heat shock protein HslJ
MKPSSPQTASWVSFTARPAVPGPVAREPAQLRGKAWIAEDINCGGAIDNLRLTQAFGADGKVSGSDNCNRFNGTDTADGSKLTVSPPASARRARIGKELPGQARKYMGAPGGELTWSFRSDGALLLTGADAARTGLRR